ncbi:hypothetical protein HGM15179_000510 [Zosterops borbonicus]|uniref:Uncharacterized protein n=1 Tax=Zosterops borbonicus TaxID=364589 RepID=A0A8K1LUB4_9PASS|nr:hypothetical protein HGM15179_000510 [Zosterops borbonicus]
MRVKSIEEKWGYRSSSTSDESCKADMHRNLGIVDKVTLSQRASFSVALNQHGLTEVNEATSIYTRLQLTQNVPEQRNCCRRRSVQDTFGDVLDVGSEVPGRAGGTGEIQPCEPGGGATGHSLLRTFHLAKTGLTHLRMPEVHNTSLQTLQWVLEDGGHEKDLSSGLGKHLSSGRFFNHGLYSIATKNNRKASSDIFHVSWRLILKGGDGGEKDFQLQGHIDNHEVQTFALQFQPLSSADATVYGVILGIRQNEAGNNYEDKPTFFLKTFNVQEDIETSEVSGGKALEESVQRIADAPFLEMFKDRLEEPLSNLVQWKVSLLMAEALELDDL